MVTDIPPTLSAREAAVSLNVHISTVYRWIDDGLLDIVRPGRAKREGHKARGGAVRITEASVAEKLRVVRPSAPEEIAS